MPVCPPPVEGRPACRRGCGEDRLRRALDAGDTARSLPALRLDRRTYLEDCSFGTAIAVSFARSPGQSGLHRLGPGSAQSGGRFILGLGTQVKAHIERRFGMPWPESPVGKLREQIQVIRAFWDCWQNGTKLNFRGEYYKITLMSPFFNPGPIEHPDIPIYIAGVNTGLAKLAGEMCEGFHAHPFHSPRYLREVILPAMRGRRAQGQAAQDVSISVTAFVATSPEEESFARMQIAFYASTPSYRAVMDLHGWGEVADKLSAYAEKGEWAEMPMLITDEMLEQFCLSTRRRNWQLSIAGTL